MFFDQQHLAKVLPQVVTYPHTVHLRRDNTGFVIGDSDLNQSLQFSTCGQMTYITQLVAWEALKRMPRSAHLWRRMQGITRVMLRMKHLRLLPSLGIEGVTARGCCLRHLIHMEQGRQRRQYTWREQAHLGRHAALCIGSQI